MRPKLTAEYAVGGANNISESNTIKARAPVPLVFDRNEKLQAEIEGERESGVGRRGDRKASKETPTGVKLPPAECGIQREDGACGGGCTRPSETRFRVKP